MMKTFSKFVAISLSMIGLAAQPAMATKTSDNSTATTANAAPTADQKKASGKQYCVNVEAVTGSRLPQRVCQTKSQWEAEGVDVTAKQR
jgi:hypothetical protein